MGNALQSISNTAFGAANTGDSNVPLGYQGYNMQGMDANYQNSMQSQQGYNQDMSSMSGNAMNLYNQQANNPYAQQLQQNANYTGNNMMGMANQMQGMGNQLYQTAFDPNNALYNQQLQQNTDQTNASLSERGLSNSGFGAGISNQSNQNFNTNWQQTQLQNQLAATGQIGNMYNQAGTMGQTGGQLSFNAGNAITNQQNTAMQNYYGNMNPLISGQQNLAQGYGNYMGIGNQGSQINQTGSTANQPKGILGSVGLNFSDRRLKKNIERIGTTDSGLGIYSFDYIWGAPSIGVMADEVEKVIPNAVITRPDGFKMVDYAQL